MATSSSSSSSSVFTSSSSSGPIPEVTQSMVPGVVVQAEMVPHDSTVTVEEALGSLTTTLEDFLGHYSELQKLEEMVQVIETLVRVSSLPDCCLILSAIGNCYCNTSA